MRLILPVLLALASVAPARAQHAAHADTAAVERTLELRAADLRALPHVTVRAAEHGSTRAAEWSGVPLAVLLARAGVPSGERLRGPALATYVVVEAADGYRAVFSLAELDPALGGRTVLVVDARDGVPLGTGQGPLRLAVPDDRRQSRWVRQVVRVRVRRG